MRAGVAVKQKHLDALQQNTDVQLGLDAKSKQAFMAKLLPALLAMLGEVPPQSQRNAENALRASAIHMLRKNSTPQVSYVLAELCEAVFTCCITVIEQDNQENAVLCCSLVGSLIRFRRHCPSQPNTSSEAENLAATLLRLLLTVRVSGPRPPSPLLFRIPSVGTQLLQSQTAGCTFMQICIAILDRCA